MKTILIPTDFSENSRNAAIYAFELFKDSPCTFYFLHTYSPTIYTYSYQVEAGVFGTELNEVLRTTANEQTKAFVEDVLRNHDNKKHTINTITTCNFLADEIKNLVEEKDIDIVVMGTKGATGAKEVLFGSNTVHVMDKCKCTVIAVPENYTFSPIQSILFPTDLHLEYKEKHVKELIEIAEKHKATIKLFHVDFRGLKNSQREHKAELEELLSDVNTEFILEDFKDVEGAIHDYQKNHSTELLMMINNKHSFLENLLFKPTVSKIALHLDTPFLVVRE